MRIIFILLSILFFWNMTIAQDKSRPFVINGNINADSGTVVLNLLTEDVSFYPKGMRKMTSNVENGKFAFKGEIPYPQGVYLSYNSSYVSDMFIIDPGMQAITLNIDSVREIPMVNNASMEEYHTEYAPAFASVKRSKKLLSTKIDSLKRVYKSQIPQVLKLEIEASIRERYKKHDSTLVKYVATHSNSYLALWKLVHLLNFGYEEVFDSTFSKYSEKLRKTTTGITLSEKLQIAGILAPNKQFPGLSVADRKNKPMDPATFARQKYTLIEFWYSNCGPCIAQFPDLNKIYSQYRDAGFEIIGISTDKKKYKENWLTAIEKHTLLWPQYWDVDGNESRKISIVAFPTNFLVDESGKIIQKNLKPAELERFLSDNLSPVKKN